MRRLMLAAGAVCAAAVMTQWAAAQVNTMPGQVVGTGFSGHTVGNPIPKAAPPAGQPINLPNESALMRKYDPSRPYDVFKGTNLTPNMLAAPVTSMDTRTNFEKLKAFVGMGPPATPAAMPSHSTYFPSLTRRNRERAEERLWRRD